MTNLKKTLKSERVKVGKETVIENYNNYLENRKKSQKDVDVDKLKEELKEIKKYSIENLDELKRKTIKNLKEQNIQVFEAKDAKEARKIALKLIPKGKKVVKSKSNVVNEICLERELLKRNEFTETDCGDFIIQITEEKECHPVSPAIHIPLEKITETIKEKFKAKLPNDPAKITHWIRDYIKKKIFEADIGITGANVLSADGGIFILENEGNISLVSRLPKKHIIITSIDKIVPRTEDAVKICKAAAIWGSGVPLPTYINVISSLSRTADVQKNLIWGMYGPEEVSVILIDNGRSEMIKEGFTELLECINCGACLFPCPIYRNILDKYGFHYFGGRGVGMTVFQQGLKEGFKNGLYYCTTCELCKQNCPMDIDIPKVIKELRKRAVKNNLETETNSKMMDNIRTSGNPFGEDVKEGEIPDKLYCC
ncbi:MAG: lactate utilization protein [Candidatus Aenigmarchaeota archaeon]|nr:lactate utilization protein [Candidatus Aenigmarchaeota archaeon]